MTIVKLQDSAKSLWVHSPIKITEADANYIKSLGQVQYIMAPNLKHHLHIQHF